MRMVEHALQLPLQLKIINQIRPLSKSVKTSLNTKMEMGQRKYVQSIASHFILHHVQILKWLNISSVSNSKQVKMHKMHIKLP